MTTPPTDPPTNLPAPRPLPASASAHAVAAFIRRIADEAGNTPAATSIKTMIGNVLRHHLASEHGLADAMELSDVAAVAAHDVAAHDDESIHLADDLSWDPEKVKQATTEAGGGEGR